MIDVHNTMCSETDCCVNASYGYEINQALFCSYHAKRLYPSAILVKGKKCEIEDCTTTACFGDIGTRSQFCFKHKSPTMISLREKRSDCAACGLSYLVTGLDVDGLCCYCRPNKSCRTKENSVKKLLYEKLPEYKFEQNSYQLPSIRQAQLRYRPDFWLELSSHIVVIEVDEFSHSSYQDDCEIVRMINISMSCEGKPVVFIRYNPDASKHSVTLRHKVLIDTIQSHIGKVPTKIIVAEYLYYPKDKADKFQEMLKTALCKYGSDLN